MTGRPGEVPPLSSVEGERGGAPGFLRRLWRWSRRPSIAPLDVFFAGVIFAALRELIS